MHAVGRGFAAQTRRSAARLQCGVYYPILAISKKLGEMAIKDWSKSAGLALGYTFLIVILLLAFGPLSLLLANGELLRSLHSSAQVFGTYAAAVTIVTTAIATAFLSWNFKRRYRRNIEAYAMLGGIIGVIVGLLMMIPITVGVSLVVAPAAGVITSVIVVLVREFQRGKKPEAKSS